MVRKLQTFKHRTTKENKCDKTVKTTIRKLNNNKKKQLNTNFCDKIRLFIEKKYKKSIEKTYIALNLEK